MTSGQNGSSSNFLMYEIQWILMLFLVTVKIDNFKRCNFINKHFHHDILKLLLKIKFLVFGLTPLN